MVRLYFLAALLLVAAPARFVVAETFPGPVDQAIIGDWQCGETRVFITLLGSIELVDEGYTAGLIRAEEGRLRIEWDADGSRTAWGYAAEGGELTLRPSEDEHMRCIQRS